jgi:hypothetical protein
MRVNRTVKLGAVGVLSVTCALCHVFVFDRDWHVRLTLLLRGYGPSVERFDARVRPEPVRWNSWVSETLWRHGVYVGSVDPWGDVVLSGENPNGAADESFRRSGFALAGEAMSGVGTILVGIFLLPHVVLWGRRNTMGFPIEPVALAATRSPSG